MPEAINNVMDTAFWVAYYRARESERADALFHDPLAARLAGEHGKEVARAMPMGHVTGWIVAIRTCIIDDFVNTALAQGVDLVLNLGAGLDTRPYRMDLPKSLTWIEADFAQMIDYKEAQLAQEKPHCHLERIKIDLANALERRAMLQTINARAKKLLIITEGVIPYLSVEDVASLADDIRALDHAQLWVAEYMSPTIRKGRQRLARKMRNAPFKFWPPDWFAFFEAHGWEPEHVRYTADEGDQRRRPFPLPFFMKLIMIIRSPFLSPEKRKEIKKFSAFILLKPKI